MSTLYYLARQGKQFGPYTWSQLQEIAGLGYIAPDDLLWSSELTEWTSADRVPGLLSEGYIAAGAGREQAVPDPEPESSKVNPEIAGTATASGKPAPKSRKRLYLAGGAVAMLLLAVVMVFFLWPEERVDQLGTFSVATDGGIFSHDGIELLVSGGSGTFSVSQVEKREQQPEEVAYQSPYYRLEGYLDQLQGEVHLTLPLSSEALPSVNPGIDELSDTLFIVMEEEVFTPSAGVQTAERYLETTVDPEAGTVSAVMHFEGPTTQAGFNPAGLLASTGPALMEAGAEEPKRITDQIEFQIRRYKVNWRSVESPSGFFRVIFQPGIPKDSGAVYPGEEFQLFLSELPEENLKELLDTLEDQKARILKAGFNFDQRREYPIDVRLVDEIDDRNLYNRVRDRVRGKEFEPPSGLFRGSKISDQYADILLLRELVEEGGSGPELRATFGHELLHLAQQLYDTRHPYRKSHGGIEQPYFWLDEAVATWFEPYAKGKRDYLPENAKRNVDFIHTPLYFPGSTVGRDEREVVEDHGYGASHFFRYLVELTEDYYPAYIYNEVAKQTSGNRFAGDAVNYALWLEEGYYSMSRLWPNFLSHYLLKPDNIISGLETSQQLIKPVGLVVEPMEGEASGNGKEETNYRIYYDVSDRLEDNKTGSSVEDLQSGEPVDLSLQFRQENLTADALRVLIADDEIHRKALGGPGRLVVEVQNRGHGGALVYALDQESRISDIAGVTMDSFDYLYSEPNISEHDEEEALVPEEETNPRAVIENFGWGEDSFREVVIIPFNHDSVGELDVCDIDIDITFKPAAEEVSRLAEKWEVMVKWEDIDVFEGHRAEDPEEVEASYRRDLIGEERSIGSFYLEPGEDGYLLIKEGEYDYFDYHVSPPEFLLSYQTKAPEEFPSSVNGNAPSGYYYTAEFKGQFESENLITGTYERLSYRAQFTMSPEGEVDNIPEFIPQWDGKWHFQGYQPEERRAGTFWARKTDP